MTDITEARRMTAEKFAALFADPRDAYPYVAADKREQMIAMMRQRAEAWVSSALGRPMPVIEACDDIEVLRLIYGACQISSAAIREWWKAVEKARRKAEREEAKAEAQGMSDKPLNPWQLIINKIDLAHLGKLAEELADVLAGSAKVIERIALDDDRIGRRIAAKKNHLGRWHDLLRRGPSKAGTLVPPEDRPRSAASRSP